MKISKQIKTLTMAILVPWIIVLLIRAFGPIGYKELDISLYIHIFIFVIFCGLGVIFGFLVTKKQRHDRAVNLSRKINALNQKHSIFLLLSIIYLSISLYDAFRGFVFEMGVTEARYAAMLEGPRNSFLGAVKYMLSGVPVYLACLAIYKASFKHYFPFKKLTWFVIIAAIASYFLSGGRNSFVISTCVILIFWKLTLRHQKDNAHLSMKNTKLKIGILVAAGFVYSLYLFAERAGVRGEVIQESIKRMAWDYNAKERWFGLDSNSFFTQVYGILIYFIFYITHALGYYSDYLTIDYTPNAIGSYSFNFIFNVFDVLTNLKIGEALSYRLLVPGVYLTLPGSFYVDFGLIGVVFSGFVLGLLSTVYFRKTIYNFQSQNAFRASILFTALIFSPVYSVTNIGNGFSLVTIALIANVSFRSKKQNYLAK